MTNSQHLGLIDDNVFQSSRLTLSIAILRAVGESRHIAHCKGRGKIEDGVPLASYLVVKLTITNALLTAVVASTATGPATCQQDTRDKMVRSHVHLFRHF